MIGVHCLDTWVFSTTAWGKLERFSEILHWHIKCYITFVYEKKSGHSYISAGTRNLVIECFKATKRRQKGVDLPVWEEICAPSSWHRNCGQPCCMNNPLIRRTWCMHNTYGNVCSTPLFWLQIPEQVDFLAHQSNLCKSLFRLFLSKTKIDFNFKKLKKKFFRTHQVALVVVANCHLFWVDTPSDLHEFHEIHEVQKAYRCRCRMVMWPIFGMFSHNFLKGIIYGISWLFPQHSMNFIWHVKIAGITLKKIPGDARHSRFQKNFNFDPIFFQQFSCSQKISRKLF